MSERSRARHIVDRFIQITKQDTIDENVAYDCALLCVDEILKIGDEQFYNYKYWEEVKKQIEILRNE